MGGANLPSLAMAVKSSLMMAWSPPREPEDTDVWSSKIRALGSRAGEGVSCSGEIFRQREQHQHKRGLGDQQACSYRGLLGLKTKGGHYKGFSLTSIRKGVRGNSLSRQRRHDKEFL